MVADQAGVSPEVFWNGDPAWTWVRIRSYEKECRDKIRREDALNHQLGYYIMFAIAAAMNKDNKYPDEQMFYELTAEEKQAKLEAEIDRAFGIV